MTAENSHEIDKYMRCYGCGIHVATPVIAPSQRAICPRCGTHLYKGERGSLSGNFALAVTCLILFIPAFGFDFIHINLVGITINASFSDNVSALWHENFYFLACLVSFCGLFAPLLLCITTITTHIALKKRHFEIFKISVGLMQGLKSWSMVDVFLISIAIACFKLKDYADIFVEPGLVGLIALQLTSVLLVTRINIHRYWDLWSDEEKAQSAQKFRKPPHPQIHSKQTCIIFLLCALIATFPANLLTISILFTNGQRLEDTIFSGVVSLIDSGMYGIAIIIFVASILVPLLKIFGLGYLLACSYRPNDKRMKQKMALYFLLKWIGKWSMIDLFVIAIMLTLVDRGQLLDFSPSTGAIAFGAVVVFTMFSTHTFQSQWLWNKPTEIGTTQDAK